MLKAVRHLACLHALRLAGPCQRVVVHGHIVRQQPFLDEQTRSPLLASGRPYRPIRLGAVPPQPFMLRTCQWGRISRRCLFACYLGLTPPSLAIRLCQFGTGRPAAVDQNTRTTRHMAAQDQRFSDLERSLADAARLIGESKREIKRSQGLLQDQEFRTGAAANPGPRGPDDGDRGSVVRERS